MYKILETKTFSSWLISIKDLSTQVRLLRRLDRARLGNFGDVKYLVDGIYEMREKFGSGWRMYYVLRTKKIIVMLCGGSKATQANDIKAAKKIANLLED